MKEEGATEGEFFVFLNKSDLTERKVKLVIGVYSDGKKSNQLKQISWHLLNLRITIKNKIT